MTDFEATLSRDAISGDHVTYIQVFSRPIYTAGETDGQPELCRAWTVAAAWEVVP